MNLIVVIFLLPVFFIIHELEEIAMIRKWIVRNSRELYCRFPKLSGIIGWMERVNTRSVAIIAAEELVIVLACTFTSAYTGNITAWYCCMAAFGIHLVVHLIQFIVWRNYIPAIITSLACLPYCIFALTCISDLLTPEELVLYAAVGLVAGGLNLFAMHFVAGKTWYGG